MHSKRQTILLGLLAGIVISPGARAQSATNQESAAAAATSLEQPVILSPFDVSTDKDQGYKATNSTSGTRLNTEIKDLPMPINVLTEQYIADLGTSDLRGALRYSADIQTTDWNTFGQQGGSFDNSPGKLNNPEGATASAAQTTVKFRGFETESVLRDGFARGNATDSVNLERVELVGGPSSLLYGVSNFGGVVNYFVKQPQEKTASDFELTTGSYSFERATFDVTGPIAKGLAYRITGSAETAGSWTDFNKEKHFFVSPIITYKPFAGTKVTLDIEYGRQHTTGIGWQDLRAAPGYINQDTNVEYGFLPLGGGESPRTFRWSGPDTYNDNESNNVEFKIEQQIAKGLSLWAGFDQSTFNYSQLDNMAALQAASNFSNAPASDIANVAFVPLSGAQTGISTGSTPSVITYQWEKKHEDTTIDQARIDLTYHFSLLESHKWLRMDNSFLVGYDYQRNVDDYHTWQTPGNTQNYHSPTDFSPIHYGTQSSGQPDEPVVQYDNHKSTTPDAAYYAVYQGRLLDNRLTLVAGVRHDRSYNTYWQYDPEYQLGGGQNQTTASLTRAPNSSDRTIQWGVNFEITHELSIYAMNAGGVQPNYTGQLDDTGQSIKSTLARDSEVGLKFDLLNGKVSGTVSWYTINRTRAPVGGTNAYWWAPTNVPGRATWNPSKDIIYQLDGGLNPAVNSYPESTAAASQWNAAVAAGAIFQATNNGGNKNWYVDASKATGAAFMDAVYAKAAADKDQDWFGWLYNTDNITNNASLDQAGAADGNNDVLLGSDRSSGFDGNILIRPNDNLQIVLSYAYTKKVVVNGGQWIKYPYPQDRWAVWYDPVTWAGLQGKALSQVFTNPSDTSTWIAYSSGAKEDDTPRNQGSAWINYMFEKASQSPGLTLGAGASYTGPRQWLSGITPLGTVITDSAGNPIDLETTSMVVLDGMARYEFRMGTHAASVQFNVNNIANERRQTVPGAWEEPRTWRLSFGMHF